MAVRSSPLAPRKALLLLSVCLGACGPASLVSSPTETMPASVATSKPSATILPTGVRSPAASTFTANPPTTPEATPVEVTPELPMEEPPGAFLQVEGGDPIQGDLGSFTWKNGGSDGPWIPGNPMHVGAGEVLVFSLAPPGVVANWTASRQVPGPPPLSGLGAIGMGHGSRGSVSFLAPPPGEWSVSVDVSFSGGLGSASYYWLIEVD